MSGYNHDITMSLPMNASSFALTHGMVHGCSVPVETSSMASTVFDRKRTGYGAMMASEPQHKKQRRESNSNQLFTSSQSTHVYNNHGISVTNQVADHQHQNTNTNAITESESGSAQTSKWIAKYLELIEFKRLHGHCCVPTKWHGNFALAQWVKRQRYQYQLAKAGKPSSLTKQRRLLLDQAEFVWDLQDAVWEERLNDLMEFRKSHGHCKVPSKYPQNPDLAIWAKCQRRHFSAFCAHTSSGREWTSITMSMERILKLAKVGFVFDNRSDKGALEALILRTKPC
jgi:Helicase associated domain